MVLLLSDLQAKHKMPKHSNWFGTTMVIFTPLMISSQLVTSWFSDKMLKTLNTSYQQRRQAHFIKTLMLKEEKILRDYSFTVVLRKLQIKDQLITSFIKDTLPLTFFKKINWERLSILLKEIRLINWLAYLRNKTNTDWDIKLWLELFITMKKKLLYLHKLQAMKLLKLRYQILISYKLPFITRALLPSRLSLLNSV